jgi:hypothetical protein
VKGIVLTMYDGRTNLSADVAAEVRRHFGPKVFGTLVPRSVRLSEAPSFGLPICLYRPESPGALAYRALARELLDRDGSTADASQASRPPVGDSNTSSPSASVAAADDGRRGPLGPSLRVQPPASAPAAAAAAPAPPRSAPAPPASAPGASTRQADSPSLTPGLAGSVGRLPAGGRGAGATGGRP